MNYALSIEIALDRNRVLEIFEDQDSMTGWQPGLVSFEHLDDPPGIPGARTRLVYDIDDRRVEMTETIELLSRPDTMIFIYEADKVWNRCVNRFEETEEGTTLWTQENEFRCRGFMAILTALFPGNFRRETATSMERFKDYAESLGPNPA